MAALKQNPCKRVDIVLDNFDVSLPIPSKVPRGHSEREKGAESSWHEALHTGRETQAGTQPDLQYGDIRFVQRPSPPQVQPELTAPPPATAG